MVKSVRIQKRKTRSWISPRRNSRPWYVLRNKLRDKSRTRPWRAFFTRLPLSRPKRFFVKKEDKKALRLQNKKRRRFTSKQKPLLNLFLLQAPWRTARYSLKSEKSRLDSHVRAFRLYYNLDESSCNRLLSSLQYRTSKVRLLFDKFEGRLDTVLVRIGWASNLTEASAWVSSGFFSAERLSALWGWQPVVVGNDFRLLPGDRLKVINKSIVSRSIRRRYFRTHWRLKSRALVTCPKPRGFNPRMYHRYRRTKRSLVWTRFLRYFLHHPPSFVVNYNSLTACFRPSRTWTEPTVRYPRYLGRGFFFWREALRAR